MRKYGDKDMLDVVVRIREVREALGGAGGKAGSSP